VSGVPELEIRISLRLQRLELWRGGRQLARYRVSTALNGAGERQGSGCTPRGAHLVRAKIGRDRRINTVFVSRRPTGEIYTPALAAAEPQRDWILTRILWLSGTERGRNRLGEVDTFRRFIYIHGCPEETPMGVPGSHGCIRMRSPDVVALFDAVPVGTSVVIEE